MDVDQSYTSDTVITSALKGIGEAAQQALTAAYGSDWANYGGKLTTLGAAEGAVGLPTDTWSLKNWTVDQYKAMFEKIVKGEISIDNDFTKLASTDHVTLNLVKYFDRIPFKERKLWLSLLFSFAPEQPRRVQTRAPRGSPRGRRARLG